MNVAPLPSPSGIDAVGPLPWGTHFCQFYEERQDLLDTLVPYFAAGLGNDEACMWVTSDPLSVEGVTSALRDRVPDLDDRLADRQIEILAHEDWYRQGDVFDAERVLQHWVDRQNRALDRGFKGFRLTGNTAWLERSGWDNFVEYEGLVNASFGKYRIIALCTYCIGRCGAGDVLDVVRNHEFALARRDGRWDLLESSSLKAAKADLARANEQLEQRVRERTAELQAATAAAVAANRAKDHFLAVLSHELRTPLTPVLAGVSYLETRADLPPELRSEIGSIRRNVEMEARLIDDLLDLTRVSRGKVELHFEVVDAHAVLRNSLENYQREVEEKRVEVALNLWAKNRHVWADPARLQQVCCNLLSNAVKFTPAGGRIVLRTEDDERRRLAVRVTDTGVGIDADAMPRLFEAFEQGERTVTRRFGGLGLGLAISKALVDMHKGSLTAASDGKDKGATFTLRLDTIPVPEAPELKPPPRAGGTSPPSKELRILLVEDHEDTLRVMARLLRSFGHDVKTATTVKSALALSEGEAFDLLVSDIGLPDGSGLDIMRQVKAQRRLKGIALSGFGQDEDFRRSREAGFEQHLTKPVNFQQLQQVIQRVAC